MTKQKKKNKKQTNKKKNKNQETLNLVGRNLEFHFAGLRRSISTLPPGGVREGHTGSQDFQSCHMVAPLACRIHRDHAGGQNLHSQAEVTRSLPLLTSTAAE